MKNLVIFAVLFIFAVTCYAGDTKEYRLARVQMTQDIPFIGDFELDTAKGSLYNIRSQAFISSNAFWLKTELCSIFYAGTGCREIHEKYQFDSVSGNTIRVTDSFGRPGTIKVLRDNPIRAVLPGNVTVQFREVTFSGNDRHPDINKVWSIREALDDVVDKDTFMAPWDFFPAF